MGRQSVAHQAGLRDVGLVRVARKQRECSVLVVGFAVVPELQRTQIAAVGVDFGAVEIGFDPGALAGFEPRAGRRRPGRIRLAQGRRRRGLVRRRRGRVRWP